MIKTSDSNCPICGGTLRRIGMVKRIVRTDYGQTTWTRIRRMICQDCGVVHREIPDSLLPYKHYEARIIRGFIDNSLTSCDLEYEDYPCETTIQEWKKIFTKGLV